MVRAGDMQTWENSKRQNRDRAEFYYFLDVNAVSQAEDWLAVPVV